jgi:hypothetical protein
MANPPACYFELSSRMNDDNKEMMKRKRTRSPPDSARARDGVNRQANMVIIDFRNLID